MKNDFIENVTNMSYKLFYRNTENKGKTRKFFKKLKNNVEICSLQNLLATEKPQLYTPAEVSATINNIKPSKAISPDGISLIMLKNLSERGVDYLTRFIFLT